LYLWNIPAFGTNRSSSQHNSGAKFRSQPQIFYSLLFNDRDRLIATWPLLCFPSPIVAAGHLSHQWRSPAWKRCGVVAPGFLHVRSKATALLSLLLTTLWIALTAASSRADQVTLEQALSLMRRYNPDLSVVRQELTVAKGELQKASYLTPFNFQVAGEADYRARATRSNAQDWRIGFIQEFEIFGQRALRQKAARIGYAAAAAELSDRGRLLEGATRMTFFDAMRARDEAELLAELAKLDLNLVQAARTRLDAGEINQVEYNSAQIRYGQSHRASFQAREGYRLQRSSLGRLLGGQAGPEPEPAGETKVKPAQIEVESLIEGARNRRPDLRARQLAVAQLDTEIALNQRLNAPNPAIGMFVGHENNTEHFIGPLVGFSLPLFNRRVGEATILSGRRAQAKDQLRAAELNVEQQVRDAYNRYVTARRTLRIYEDDVMVPARQSFGLLEAAFTEGKIDLLRLSIAEREAFEARMAYVESWFDLLAAQVAIELATGAPLQTASP
jgi:outer membrane protein, heavy metal efflux system